MIDDFRTLVQSTFAAADSIDSANVAVKRWVAGGMCDAGDARAAGSAIVRTTHALKFAQDSIHVIQRAASEGKRLIVFGYSKKEFRQLSEDINNALNMINTALIDAYNAFDVVADEENVESPQLVMEQLQISHQCAVRLRAIAETIPH